MRIEDGGVVGACSCQQQLSPAQMLKPNGRRKTIALDERRSRAYDHWHNTATSPFETKLHPQQKTSSSAQKTMSVDSKLIVFHSYLKLKTESHIAQAFSLWRQSQCSQHKVTSWQITLYQCWDHIQMQRMTRYFKRGAWIQKIWNTAS